MEKALGRPYSGLPILKEGLQESWRGDSVLGSAVRQG